MMPKIICLTSVLNESWILDRFIQCASLWADNIIIGDQGSTDGSVDIIRKYDKVTFVDNPRTGEMNEGEYRAPLFEKAREIEGPKILITLDADEILTPNFSSVEWKTIRNAKPGTIISLPIHNLLPNGTYWPFGEIYCGYIDDGEPYNKGVIHAPRTIVPDHHDVLKLNEICLLHYKFMDWERYEERNRWYQCFELVNKVNKPIDIFRRYHHIDAIPESMRRPIPTWWSTEYAKLGIEITSILHQHTNMWNRQIIDYFKKYGVSFFRHLNIWEVNWCDIARELGETDYSQYRDPRHKWEKAINRYLISTQKTHLNQKTSVKIAEKLLKMIYQ